MNDEGVPEPKAGPVPPNEVWLDDWLEVFADRFDILQKTLNSAKRALWLIFWLLLIVAAFGACNVILSTR